MMDVITLQSVELQVTPERWRFAEAERTAIDQHWQRLVVEKPFLWNGRVLICTRHEIVNACLRALFSETGYASFVAWRDFGWPDRAAVNCFGVPAIVSADGALVMGLMGEHTLNGGQVYPPSGSLEPRDVSAEGTVDIEGSMRVEVREETGLDLGLGRAGQTFAVRDGQRLAVVRRFDMPMPFAEVADTFRRHTAGDAAPELASLVAIRSESDVPPGAMEYVRAIARLIFR